MADLIPPGDASAGQQPPPSGLAAQALDHVAATGPRAVGTQQDGTQAIQQIDPTDPQQVTPQEQAQYDEFTSRFRSALSNRKPGVPDQSGKPGPSLNAVVVNELNNPHKPLAIVLGEVTANLAMSIVTHATVQKITYPPDVLFHACVECVMMVYLMGNAAGILKGVPPFKGLESDDTYDFSQQELHIITDAQMQAVRAFGNMELKAGMISPDVSKQNMDFWSQQVQREEQSGKVDQSILQKIQGLLPNGGQPPEPTQGQQAQQGQQSSTTAPTPSMPTNNAGGLMPQPPLAQPGSSA